MHSVFCFTLHFKTPPVAYKRRPHLTHPTLWCRYRHVPGIKGVNVSSHHEDNHSSFLTPTVIGGRHPLPSEICAECDPPPSKNAEFDRFPLITSQRDSEKNPIMTIMKPTTGFPTSCRRSAYVTAKSPKRWPKQQFCFFFWGGVNYSIFLVE